MTINIVCVGSLKEKYWKDAIAEYQKRICAFAKINIIEVKESAYGNSDAEILKAKQEEAQRLLAYKKGFCIALEINGKSFDSIGFSKYIASLENLGNSTISFFIGGSYGLDKSFSDSLNQRISFSSFTFPHQLMRVILLEQIYRSFMISGNRTYHK